MSLICGAPQGVSVVGGGPSRRGTGLGPRSWEHRHTSMPMHPSFTSMAATAAASPSSSSESSRDSDDRRSFSQPASPHDASSYSPALAPEPATSTAAAAITMTRSVGKPGRTPSRYDWSKHMPTIKRLYIDEDKTLKQVLDIMKEEHDFIAT